MFELDEKSHMSLYFLIAQDQEYSKLIDTANAPIFGVDVNGLVTVWNKCAANISGYSSEDTMGHHLVNEFITEDFRASVQEVLDKALQGLEDSNFAFPLVTKDGRRLEILLNATSRKDAEGRIIGVVGIGQDITARIAQEQVDLCLFRNKVNFLKTTSLNLSLPFLKCNRSILRLVQPGIFAPYRYG